LINRVLDYAMGADAQAGVPQPANNVAGLGPDGTLNAPYAAPLTLAANATSLVSAQAAVSAAATGQLSSGQALQTTLNANVSAVSAVNMDTEMSHMIELENAYGANARIIAAVQAMFTQLQQVIQ
jgi:flagellar hook-associated protein 1 FlgK